MKTISLSLAIAATTLFLGACADGTETDGNETGDETGSETETDTEETDVEDVTPMWDTTSWSNWGDGVEVNCTGDGTTGTTNIVLRTDNWGYNAVIYIADTRYGRDYDEEHTLEQTDLSADDPSGYTVWERELTNKTIPSVPDQSTLFDCWDFDQADSDERSVSIAAAVYDVDDNLTDCIVFGQDPQQILDGNISGGTVSIPSWISDDCRIVGN